MGSFWSSGAKAAEEADEELVLNELKVEIGDQNAVKNMLDDAIVDFFQEKQAQYTLHYGWDNAKLLIMLVAGLIAAASHFYKHPSISESTIVYSCVAAFFAVHALLFLYSTFIEKDILLRLSKKNAQEAKSPVILVKTNFPYTEDNYSVAIEYEGKSNKCAKVDLYVGRFFDSDGYFDKDAFTKDLETIFSRFESKKAQ